MMRRRRALFVAVALALAAGPAPLAAQTSESSPPPPLRETIERLTNERLDFEQPRVARHALHGVPVLLLEDHELPLVTVAAYVRGGYGRFPRSRYGAAMGLPALLRYGGTESRDPKEVDELLERFALQLSFGSSGGSINASVNTLSEHLPTALDLWSEMLVRPRFDTLEIGAWRARQLESVRRRVDDPARLAYSEINRLLFGDHPIGWETDEADLALERLRPEVFHEIHDRIVCRDNVILGVTGDSEWSALEPLLDDLVQRIPPCAAPLPPPPVPEIRRAPGVFLIEKEIAQSVVVMAHPTSVRLAEDTEYFAAMLGNSILGAGGFSSRMLSRVRTEEGYAYSATSLWTTPRTHDGIVGATTRTRPENTAPAIELILRTMEELRRAPPTDEELGTTVDRIVNGFVFNFDTPAAIVARTMYYLAQDMPEDWLERYWRGVQRITPEDVRRVFEEHLRPDQMTILVVGDPARLQEELASVGPLTVLQIR